MKVLKLVIVVLCICIFPSKINAQNRVCIDELLLFDLDTVNYVATFSGISPFAPEGDLGGNFCSRKNNCEKNIVCS